jgi:hypothetical protein
VDYDSYIALSWTEQRQADTRKGVEVYASLNDLPLAAVHIAVTEPYWP